MESPRKQRRQQLQSVFEPGFKQMLLVSVLLHLLLPVLYYSPFFPRRAIEKPPVYRVNLVNKIVKNPQAGRPEATPVEKKPAIKPKSEPKPAAKPKPVPAKPKPVPVKPKPAPEPAPKPVPVKPKPVPQAEPVKKKPAPEPKPAVSKTQENMLQKRLEQIRLNQQIKANEEARRAKIEALKATALAESSNITSPVAEAPVGMMDGKGDEAGVSATAYVQEFIQQQWSFSKYQAVGNPEAEVTMFYSAEGTLLHYKFIKKSGNSAFDESLTRAIAKSRQLDQPLPGPMEFQIFFNLKDMLDSL